MSASPGFASDCTVFLFDEETGACLAQGDPALAIVQQLVVTTGGGLVAYLDTKGALYLWRPKEETRARQIANGLGRDGKLALSHDERCLITAADELCFWQLPDGQKTRALGGHGGFWHLLVRDQREALTAANDWMVSLWDLQAGKEVVSLGLDDEARDLSMAADGRALFVGDGRGDVYTFEVERGVQPAVARIRERPPAASRKRKRASSSAPVKRKRKGKARPRPSLPR
jgi:hypothetical protein